MNWKVFSLSIPVALLSLLTTGNTAQAALLRSMDNYTEADLIEDIESGSFVEEFTLATYIGNDGTASSELEVNESLPAGSIDLSSYRGIEQTSQSEFLWNNEEEVDFELSFDGEAIAYRVGGEVINTINVGEAEFEIDSMVLNPNSTENTQTKLTNLVLNNDSISSTDLIAEAGGVDFFKITGIENDRFPLSGTQVFSSTGVEAEEIDLAYQIRVGTFRPTSDLLSSANFSILGASMNAQMNGAEVPEPRTVSLFSLLLVGLIFNRCRRSN